MMSTPTADRRFVSELREHEDLDQVFLVTEKQLRPNRQGNLYLQLRLSDRTGSLTGMMWNANEGHYAQVDGGGFVRVRGTTQSYNGQMQVLIKQLHPVPPTDVDPSDYKMLDSSALDQLAATVTAKLQAIRDDELRNLMQCLLDMPEVFPLFCRAPAAMRNHHAYEGGLLEHVAQLMELTESVCRHYSYLDRDLLIAGVFLHDIGKIDELQWEHESGYTDVGQLVGHLVLGVRILDRAIERFRQVHGTSVSGPLVSQLQHLIVSHHGKLEFGSPKVPMTLEALTLSYLDDLDAKLHQFQQIMASDLNAESHWTTYHTQLGRKLFKAAAHVGPQ
ncbi:MAG: HD domain-containing protein [Planctomycetota bacterium]|nr:HD domain-containing protein [Planctomycetota bacterium]